MTPNEWQQLLEDPLFLPFCTDDWEKIKPLLRKYGRPYIGIKAPKSYRRQWQRKACFRNSALIACCGDGAATYVEGLFFDGTHGFQHAWITLDGKHAIDPTLPNAQEYAYFGIKFPTKLVAKRSSRNSGYIISLLDDPEIAASLNRRMVRTI